MQLPLPIDQPQSLSLDGGTRLYLEIQNDPTSTHHLHRSQPACLDLLENCPKTRSQRPDGPKKLNHGCSFKSILRFDIRQYISITSPITTHHHHHNIDRTW